MKSLVFKALGQRPELDSTYDVEFVGCLPVEGASQRFCKNYFGTITALKISGVQQRDPSSNCITICGYKLMRQDDVTLGNLLRQNAAHTLLCKFGVEIPITVIAASANPRLEQIGNRFEPSEKPKA